MIIFVKPGSLSAVLTKSRQQFTRISFCCGIKKCRTKSAQIFLRFQSPWIMVETIFLSIFNYSDIARSVRRGSSISKEKRTAFTIRFEPLTVDHFSRLQWDYRPFLKRLNRMLLCMTIHPLRTLFSSCRWISVAILPSLKQNLIHTRCSIVKLEWHT